MATGNQRNFLSGHCGHRDSLRKQGRAWQPGPSHCPRGGSRADRAPRAAPSPASTLTWGQGLAEAMAGQSRAMGTGDHPCCSISGAGPGRAQGQQWCPGLQAGLGSPDRAGEATDTIQALTALCLVGLLALTEFRMHLLQWR